MCVSMFVAVGGEVPVARHYFISYWAGTALLRSPAVRALNVFSPQWPMTGAAGLLRTMNMPALLDATSFSEQQRPCHQRARAKSAVRAVGVARSWPQGLVAVE